MAGRSPALSPRHRRVVRFLCEAAPATGLGHFVRSVTLATELAGRGARVEVLLKPDALPRAREAVTTAGLDLGCGTWETAVRPDDGPADLVVDSYRVSGAWLTETHRALRSRGGRLAVIDDLADRSFDADLVVNQNLGAEGLAYPGAGQVLAGPRYALLRPQFAASRAAGTAGARALPDVPRVVLVLFGGTDPAGMTGVAARAALAAFPAAQVRVVTPAEAGGDDELAADPRVRVLRSHPDIHHEMLAAELVVTAGGTTLWELCCLARPAAVVAVAANQTEVYDRMSEGGFVLPLSRRPEHSVPALARRLTSLLAAPGRLRRVAVAGATVTDGRGAQLVADALMA